MSTEPATSPARPTRVKASSLLALVLLAAGVAACGTQAYGQPAGSPASWPLTVTGPDALTAADNGATVRLHPGQRVTVALAARGLFSWHVPAAAGAAVTRISASGGYPGTRAVGAAFLAVRFGRATLTATDDTACLHARPACLPRQQAWQVTVIVTPVIRPPVRGPASPAP